MANPRLLLNNASPYSPAIRITPTEHKVASGTITRITGNLIYATLPLLSTSHEYGPLEWSYLQGATTPQLGNHVCVVFDDEKVGHIVWYDAAYTGGSGPPSGLAGGDLTGSYPNPTLDTWGGQTKAQVVSGNAPKAHQASHEPGGSDALTSLTDASFATPNKDGSAATPSLRTLGTGALQAAAGNGARFTDSRTPTGTAGGDLTGTYPNPTITTIGGTAITTTDEAAANASNGGTHTTATAYGRIKRFVLKGNGSLTSFTLTHNLGNKQVLVQAQSDNSGAPGTGANTLPGFNWAPSAANAIAVTFSSAPTSGTPFYVTVFG